MEETVQALLVSGGATVLVALLSVCGTVFGPLFVERVRMKRDREREAAEQQARRHEEQIVRAEALTSALRASILRGDDISYIQSDAARLRFLAMLGPGEGVVDEYIQQVIQSLGELVTVDERYEAVHDGMSRIFAWLRGDMRTAEFHDLIRGQAASE